MNTFVKRGQRNTENPPAEIACARLGASPMVVAAVGHGAVRATTRPPKSLRPILVKLGVVAPILCLIQLLQALTFVDKAASPARRVAKLGILRGLAPGHELELAVVLGAVAAQTIAVVPIFALSALILVRRPVLTLALLAWKSDLDCENADNKHTTIIA